MRALGLDVSTKVGWAVLENHEIGFSDTVGAINCKHKDYKGRRIQRWIDTVDKLGDALNPMHVSLDIIVIEGYAFGARGRGLSSLHEMGGIMRAMMLSLKVPCFEVPPTTLKQFVTGSGKASKEAMLLAAYDTWGYAGNNDDISDALGLAWIGVALADFKYCLTLSLERQMILDTVRAMAENAGALDDLTSTEST